MTDNDRFVGALFEEHRTKFVENPPSVDKLAWGDDTDLAKYDTVSGAYDVVVAADVCYKEEIVNPLFVTASTLSKSACPMPHPKRNYK